MIAIVQNEETWNPVLRVILKGNGQADTNWSSTLNGLVGPENILFWPDPSSLKNIVQGWARVGQDLWVWSKQANHPRELILISS